MSDIYKAYKELEEENYKLEQRIYFLEQEITGLDWENSSAFDRVEQKMKEQL
jgi:cell division septum initiation protein DivIVA